MRSYRFESFACHHNCSPDLDRLMVIGLANKMEQGSCCAGLVLVQDWFWCRIGCLLKAAGTNGVQPNYKHT